MEVGGQRHAPAALPQGTDTICFVSDTEWATGPIWRDVENLAPPPPGFHPRTVQPVASRYTDYAITAHLMLNLVLR